VQTELAADAFDEVTHVLAARGARVFQPESPSYPQLIAIDPVAGLICINDATGRSSGAIVQLNRQVQTLRDALPAVNRTPVTRRLLSSSALSASGTTLAPDEAQTDAWISALPSRPMDEQTARAVADFFLPRLIIDIQKRASMADPGAAERADSRIRLDFDQTRAAVADVNDVTVLTGPPGSGKTLVLAARARRIAAYRPDWVIRILCYNRVLVPYLEAMVADHVNVEVMTFGRFASSIGVRQMSLSDEDTALRDFKRVERTLAQSIDALLIDEWQDFFPAWTMLALAALRRDRGGAMLAGDPRQALYRETDGIKSLAGHSVSELELGRPYRSTRQILEVTSALGEEHQITGQGQPLEGEPVDLVWAQNAEEQARAIARDIRMLIDAGEREPHEIGVLATRRWVMGRVRKLLDEAGVPARVVYPNQARELDWDDSTVNIMTVHSAKGLEFDVVFLLGLEHLPAPDGDPDNDRQGRTGYVGLTRARDQLVLTYSKDNIYLERIRSLADTTLRRWVWPDDYPEV
jgi:hypothetical protein